MQNKIIQDYKQAMKDKDSIKKELLNYLLSQIKYKSLEIQKDLTDDDIIQVIKKEIKMMNESLEYLQQSGKIEDINIETRRIAILKEYLPSMMDAQQVKELVEQTIQRLGIQNMQKEKWKLIWAIMQTHKNVIDPQDLQNVINELAK